MATNEQVAFDQLTIERMSSDIGRAGLHMKELVVCMAEGRVFQFAGIDVVVVPASEMARHLAAQWAKTLK